MPLIAVVTHVLPCQTVGWCWNTAWVPLVSKGIAGIWSGMLWMCLVQPWQVPRLSPVYTLICVGVCVTLCTLVRLCFTYTNCVCVCVSETGAWRGPVAGQSWQRAEKMARSVPGITANGQIFSVGSKPLRSPLPFMWHSLKPIPHTPVYKEPVMLSFLMQ